MGKVYPEIDAKIRHWVERQKVFFVATAPLSQQGLVNCSPKGMDTLRILGPNTITYLDLTGSGVETIAHLKENKRIVLMMCAFEGPPKIFRFHGEGEALEQGTSDYEDLLPHFPDYPGARAIIRITVHRISDSCGYSLPLYDYTGERDTLLKWTENKGEKGVQEYWKQKNTASIDGLKGLETP